MKSCSDQLKRDALAIFQAALRAGDAGNAVRRHVSVSSSELKAGSIRLSLHNFERIFLVGAGKASVSMASALEDILGPAISGGIVVTKHGHVTHSLRYVSIIEAAHPIPDAAGVAACESICELLTGLTARDLLLVTISGGASALLASPAPGITLEAKQLTTDLLLKAGATINELNAVRKHLSALKGGRLAALAYPATVVSLLLSDVIGDPLDVIGSGPTAPDPTTFADAIAILNKFELVERVPQVVRERLTRGAQREIAETPKPGDPIFNSVHNIVIGSNGVVLQAAAEEAASRGFRTLILSSTMQGETCEVGRVHAEILREMLSTGNPVAPPACVLSGGETTVTVHGNGLGGRNQEFALAAAIAIRGLQNAVVLSAGTDGTDGPTDAAGAIATGDTLERAEQMNLNASDYLARNDSYTFFNALGDLIKTGPTGTNVMDVHLLLACLA
jgi:glycerate 2-kinase